MMMARFKEVHPRWVLVDGELHNVSDFADILPRSRPSAFCPVCQRPVILKLGPKRVHHYAHQPEDICTVTQPETALHLNAKFHIYNQLLRTTTLYIEQRCSGCIERRRNLLWLTGWDNIQVEFTVTRFRPDVALLSNGDMIGAIEVFVTHPVEEQKAQFFDQQDIPWIEARVTSEDFYEGPDSWTAEKPLPFYRMHPPIERWTCDECQEIQRTRREQLEYRLNNYEDIHAAKMVDFYFKSGKKYREVYYVMKKVVNGEWVKAWVKMEDNKVIAVENGLITDKALARLNRAVQDRLNNFRKKGAIVDEFMKWQPWKKGNKFVARDTDRFPFRYFWDKAIGKWREDDV